MVRATQMLPHTRYSDTEARAYVSLQAHGEHQLSFQVKLFGFANMSKEDRADIMRVHLPRRLLQRLSSAASCSHASNPPGFASELQCSDMTRKLLQL